MTGVKNRSLGVGYTLLPAPYRRLHSNLLLTQNLTCVVRLFVCVCAFICVYHHQPIKYVHIQFSVL